MTQTEDIKLKQLVFLFVNKGFKRCKLWKEEEYLKTHRKTKEWRSHMIASKKIELLHKNGLSYADAQRIVIMEGNQKVNQNGLALLGTPIWTGSLEDLSNKQELWNEVVSHCFITGLFRNTIEIILKEEYPKDCVNLQTE